ncbi:MAG: bifunctional DNA-formamidopyrimidine glycosylase/DNA-(apurinic or apyrimidinic site) lyase [Tepidisphaeraceae bacterium]|jgi:formamidopyrimidine-DNA glycosylase
MPELPEVQTVVTTLRPLLVGRILGNVRVLRQDVILPAGTDIVPLLTGRQATDITRRGKKIIVTLDSGNRFTVHLGMTGRLTILPISADVAKHTHLIITVGEHWELRFHDPRRFGEIRWLGATAAFDADLGPEPLDITAAELSVRLRKTRRAIKSALLDQRLIAGLGNIYVDEALHAAAIHPLTPANKATSAQTAKLTRAIKSTLHRALRHKGSTLRDYRDAEGNSGDFQKLHRVYGREGQPCWKCGTPIKRIVIGGRSSHFCPECQARGKKRATRRHNS